MQRATRAIADTIGRIDQIAATIAAAVEQQGAATLALPFFIYRSARERAATINRLKRSHQRQARDPAPRRRGSS